MWFPLRASWRALITSVVAPIALDVFGTVPVAACVAHPLCACLLLAAVCRIVRRHDSAISRNRCRASVVSLQQLRRCLATSVRHVVGLAQELACVRTSPSLVSMPRGAAQCRRRANVELPSSARKRQARRRGRWRADARMGVLWLDPSPPDVQSFFFSTRFLCPDGSRTYCLRLADGRRGLYSNKH